MHLLLINLVMNVIGIGIGILIIITSTMGNKPRWRIFGSSIRCRQVWNEQTVGGRLRRKRS